MSIINPFAKQATKATIKIEVDLITKKTVMKSDIPMAYPTLIGILLQCAGVSVNNWAEVDSMIIKNGERKTGNDGEEKNGNDVGNGSSGN